MGILKFGKGNAQGDNETDKEEGGQAKQAQNGDRQESAGGYISVQDAINEMFRQNLNYISRTETDAALIRSQFVRTDTRFFLTVGTLDCPSGRIVVGDPLAYLPSGDASPEMALTVPAGSYPVEVSICRNRLAGIRMCTARLKLRESEAVRYERAESKEGTAIAKFADGDATGFPVDAGMMAFIDAEEAVCYRRFLAEWHEKNSGKNHYDDYFAGILAKSYEALPQYQREGGDFAEWKNPDTGKSMVMIASGFGDGLYQCFWGYDSAGELCELIVPMVDPDIAEQMDERQRDSIGWKGERGCIVTRRITEEGFKVGYMYRERPTEGVPDSGWRFFEGTEDDVYLDDSKNSDIVDIYYICDTNPDVVPFLNAPIGSAYFKDAAGKFQFEELRNF